MSPTTLRDFVNRVLASRRIRFGDVRRLQRDVLPDGIASREEAEVLIALDQSIEKTDRAWGEYLVATVTEFAVWGAGGTGTVERDTAEWLIAALTCGRPTRTTLAIAREVVREAEEADETLRAFAASRGPRSAPLPADLPAIPVERIPLEPSPMEQAGA